MEQTSLAADRGVETNVKRENRGTHEERQDVQAPDCQTWDDEFASFDKLWCGRCGDCSVDVYDRFAIDDTLGVAFQQ